MSSKQRKPLDPRCDGNFDCPAPGHAVVQRHQNGRYTYKHAPLTPGQKQTLRERRERTRLGLGGEGQ